MWDGTVGVGGHDNKERSTQERKKDGQKKRKSGPGFVAVCCTHLPALLVRGKLKMKENA